MITREMLCAAGASPTLAEAWLVPLTDAADEFDISTNERAIPWLANLGHESAGFSMMVENLNYSEGRLLALWPCTPRRMWGFTYEEARSYAHKPEAIANRVYANRFGNGNSASGDGWKYRGRGLIQLTFRDNYRGFGESIGVDLERYPDRAAEEDLAARIAGRYWSARGCNELADVGDVEGIRRAINGGVNGLDVVLQLVDNIAAVA